MVVDDSATIRQVLQMTLGQAGYEVTEPVDGEAALNLLSENNLDDGISA